MTSRPTDAAADGADEPTLLGDRWQWRHRVRAHPVWAGPYRVAVAVVGTVVIIAGLIMIPLPGQGWLTVLLGVAILATEFAWAARLLHRGRRWLAAWNAWVLRQPMWVRGLIATATALLVFAVFWVLLKWMGLPGFTPEPVAEWLRRYAYL